MAQINRNVDLEEIDSDALFGIDALKGQTILQKAVFWGSVAGGVLINVCLPLIFHTSRILCVALFLLLLLMGIAFGCNYTEDMTYGKYLWCFFFKPEREAVYRSTEDMAEIRKKADLIRKQEERKLQAKRQADPKEQKKLLMKLLIFGMILIIAVGGLMFYSNKKAANEIHHTVETEE
jgi:hypothetical protein